MVTTRAFATLGLLSLLVASAACLSVQDFGGDAPAPDDAGAPDDAEPPFSDAAKPPSGTYEWQWVNPAPTGRALYGISGTSASDVWVAGEGGTVAHYNGTSWDRRRVGADGARWFSVGTRAKDDVWVAGEDNGKIDVVHFDGKAWVESYPFAGSAFGGFSAGPGSRLFAVVDWDILELSSTGTWKRTDTSANDVFGAPVGVWTMASGEAWALTSGAQILHLPAGSTKWELLPPVPGKPSGVAGLSMAGAGSRLCAFYTGRSGTTGMGYLTYDGAWHAGPISTDPLPLDATPHGARSACFSDGSGLFVNGELAYSATPTTAPAAHDVYDFQGEKLFGAWSPDGTTAYAVGALGAFVARTAGSLEGKEVGPTLRKDLLAVDVGLDGTVLAADASQPDRSSGGDVLFYRGGALVPWSGNGFLPPRIPVAVASIDEGDAWVLANDGSKVGVAHYRDGAWGVTRFLDQGVTMSDPLAIWAPAKNDVWVTAREHCPDFDPLPNGACSKTSLAAYAWHYDGSAWTEIPCPAIYRSIHGSGPNDVWFAGDGVAHWDGKKLSRVSALTGAFTGVWASAPGRAWLWGDRAVLWDGKSTTPVEKALGAAAEWTTTGIAESQDGDVFVLTKRAAGTALLWFDPSHTKLVEQVSSDLELWAIRGRGDQLWAIGAGGASLRFAPPAVR